VTTIDRPSASRVTQPVELLVLQLRGLELWHLARRASEQAADRPDLSRQGHLDASRQVDVRRREREAILHRLSDCDDENACPMPIAVPARAVVAHRHAWARDSLTDQLTQRDFRVLCHLDNGADAVGVCVAEQPDLLIVDELLAMRSGSDVISQVAQFCPCTLIAGYVRDETAVGDLLEAGARTVFTWRVTPGDMADRLSALVV
jgi:hypothetical protein